MSFVKKIASGFTLALAVGAFTTFVSAQESKSTEQPMDKPMKERRWKGDGFGKRGGMRGGMGMRGLKDLDLTDAQKEQIRGIMESARTANEPLRTELKGLMEKRRGGAELSETDIARLKEIKTQMKQSHEQTQNTVLGILTAEQRQKLEQQKLERQQRRQEFRQRRQQNQQTTPNTPTSLEKNDGK